MFEFRATKVIKLAISFFIFNITNNIVLNRLMAGQIFLTVKILFRG